ncbi:hypothetical protein GC163_06165 [bacterium]|nr:hypothetical protein [bacterium]
MKPTNILRGLVIFSVFMASGCASFWHDLQPHRLRRLNRGPAPSMDPEFSAARPTSSLPDQWESVDAPVVRAQQ